jgi:hypothetical protein
VISQKTQNNRKLLLQMVFLIVCDFKPLGACLSHFLGGWFGWWVLLILRSSPLFGFRVFLVLGCCGFSPLLCSFLCS